MANAPAPMNVPTSAWTAIRNVWMATVPVLSVDSSMVMIASSWVNKPVVEMARSAPMVFADRLSNVNLSALPMNVGVRAMGIKSVVNSMNRA